MCLDKFKSVMVKLSHYPILEKKKVKHYFYFRWFPTSKFVHGRSWIQYWTQDAFGFSDLIWLNGPPRTTWGAPPSPILQYEHPRILAWSYVTPLYGQYTSWNPYLPVPAHRWATSCQTRGMEFLWSTLSSGHTYIRLPPWAYWLIPRESHGNIAHHVDPQHPAWINYFHEVSFCYD